MNTAVLIQPTESDLNIQYDLKFAEAKKYAERKLSTIIEREGDADGSRHEPWYLKVLIEEALNAMYFSDHAQKITAICKDVAIEIKRKGSQRSTT